MTNVTSKTIIAFGETLWDLLPTGPKLGGAPFNFASRVNSLGDRGAIVSRLGLDELGASARDQIIERGIDIEFLQWDEEHPTGTVNVTLDANKEPDYTIVPNVAYDYIEMTGHLRDLARTADCVCFGTVAQRNAASRLTLNQLLSYAPDAFKLFDINLRKSCYTPEIIDQSLEYTDILKLNEAEAAEIAGLYDLDRTSLSELLQMIVDKWSLSCCVITLEERGVFAASYDGAVVHVPGFSIDLVDPLGAGDAFTAGFIHRYLCGEPLGECCLFGNILGALVASQEGATAPISPQDIAAFAESHDKRNTDPRLKEYVYRGNK